MNRLADSNAGDSTGRTHRSHLQIDLGRRRRLRGWIGYLVLFVATCALAVWFLRYFAVPISLAIVIVVFMVAYMVLMGWWGSRNLEGKQ